MTSKNVSNLFRLWLEHYLTALLVFEFPDTAWKRSFANLKPYTFKPRTLWAWKAWWKYHFISSENVYDGPIRDLVNISLREQSNHKGWIFEVYSLRFAKYNHFGIAVYDHENPWNVLAFYFHWPVLNNVYTLYYMLTICTPLLAWRVSCTRFLLTAGTERTLATIGLRHPCSWPPEIWRKTHELRTKFASKLPKQDLVFRW